MCFINIMHKNYTRSYDIHIPPHPDVSCGISVGEILLSLDATTVFLVYMYKLVCSNIVIATRKQSWSNIYSNQGNIGEKYGYFSVIAINSEK